MKLIDLLRSCYNNTELEVVVGYLGGIATVDGKEVENDNYHPFVSYYMGDTAWGIIKDYLEGDEDAVGDETVYAWKFENNELKVCCYPC